MTNGCPQGGIRLLLEHFELRDQKEKDSAKETAGSKKRNCRKHRRKRREVQKETAESTEGNGREQRGKQKGEVKWHMKTERWEAFLAPR